MVRRRLFSRKAKNDRPFDPDDLDNVKHTKIGVWDLYEQKFVDRVPLAAYLPGFKSYATIRDALPFVGQMLKDVASIHDCRLYFAAYIVVETLASLIPALLLSYQGRLLQVVQIAVEKRTVDTHVLFSVALGGFVCSVLTRLFRRASQHVMSPLNLRIRSYYSVHIFDAMARLDVPTFDNHSVQRQLEAAVPKHTETSIAFQAITTSLHIITTIIRLLSQFGVLYTILKDQPDGSLLALIGFAYSFLQYANVHQGRVSNGIWAATTTDQDYIRSEGLKRAISNPIHRKEIVASGIGPFLLAQYKDAVFRISDRAGDFFYRVGFDNRDSDLFNWNTVLSEIFHILPEVIFCLRAIQHPITIPISLTSLNLIKRTTSSFTKTVIGFLDQTGTIADQYSSVRQLYEIAKIPNRVAVHVPKESYGSGKQESLSEPLMTSSPEDLDDPILGVPFPEDSRSLEQGISIEFRDVSFQYPEGDMYALRNVSFKIQRGQLCVIVGNNGSGKSTILKLIARLYDPSEGQILINDLDIKTIRLADLRRAISVLFQDYTHFPLSIRDNIGLGDPLYASSLSKIQKAAELGGAAEIIERLPEKYDTYLERPVQDYYSALPEGTMSIFGRPVDFGGVRKAGGLGQENRGLSGGQMQRIALLGSRTFMRSVVSEESVGLLLFDEPSASLDPTAEHDLFERLRQLRGSKTMIFSSHRFGNLTRHADLILYMNDSVVVEEGTHDQLLKKEGDYSRIWMLQAQAFL